MSAELSYVQLKTANDARVSVGHLIDNRARMNKILSHDGTAKVIKFYAFCILKSFCFSGGSEA